MRVIIFRDLNYKNLLIFIHFYKRFGIFKIKYLFNINYLYYLCVAIYFYILFINFNKMLPTVDTFTVFIMCYICQ